MDKTIEQLKDLFWEYKNSNDQNAYIAVEECIEIVLNNKKEQQRAGPHICGVGRVVKSVIKNTLKNAAYVGASWYYSLNLTKGKLMGNLIEALCAVCNATTNFYPVKPNELCSEHYFEWAEEKMYMEFDRSTEDLYV